MEFLTSIKIFYEQTTACVRITGNVISFFTANICLRQVYGMCSWLFSVYMDEVVGEVHERTQGREVTEITENGFLVDYSLQTI